MPVQKTCETYLTIFLSIVHCPADNSDGPPVTNCLEWNIVTQDNGMGK